MLRKQCGTNTASEVIYSGIIQITLESESAKNVVSQTKAWLIHGGKKVSIEAG